MHRQLNKRSPYGSFRFASSIIDGLFFPYTQDGPYGSDLLMVIAYFLCEQVWFGKPEERSNALFYLGLSASCGNLSLSALNTSSNIR